MLSWPPEQQTSEGTHPRLSQRGNQSSSVAGHPWAQYQLCRKRGSQGVHPEGRNLETASQYDPEQTQEKNEYHFKEEFSETSEGQVLEQTLGPS